MVLMERFLTFGQKPDSFSLGINFKNWIFRYSEVERWRKESRNLMINYLHGNDFRRRLVEKAHPRDQYRAMELMARFSNPDSSQIRDGYYENMVEIVGDLYGRMLVHHLGNPDKSGLKEFIDRKLLLTIDNRSKAFGLNKALMVIRDQSIEMDEKTQDYFASILFKDLQINTLEVISRHNGSLPPVVLDKVLEMLHEREKRERQSLYFGKKM